MVHTSNETPNDEEEGSLDSLDKVDGGDDQPNGMPGQLPTEAEAPFNKDCHEIKKAAVKKIQQLVREEVVMKTCNNGPMTWKVIV